MKKTRLYLFTIFTVLLFNGCLGSLSLVASAFSVINTSQEIEEEYEGDINDYVNDKMETTYEYIEEKVIK